MRYARPAWVLVSLLVCVSVRGAEVEFAEFRYDRPQYTYRFSFILDAEVDDVRTIVADHDRMTRMNDSFLESRILEEYPDGRRKRHLLVHSCVLFFCFDMKMVEILEARPNGDIEAVIVPEESNFRSGTTVWHLEAAGEGRTRIALSGTQSPEFWIPPLIGPILLKAQFLREAEETCSNIEKLANAGTVQ